MNCQMIRVISSPSSSTTFPSTLIFDMAPLSSCGPLAGEALVRQGIRSAFGGFTRRDRTCDSEVRDVALLRAHGLGGLPEPGQLALGQVALDDLADAGPADLGLDA